jgi:hypothetical protein
VSDIRKALALYDAVVATFRVHRHTSFQNCLLEASEVLRASSMAVDITPLLERAFSSFNYWRANYHLPVWAWEPL